MTLLLYWFGVFHAAAYAVAGGALLASRLIGWAVRRFRLQADLVRAFGQMLAERRELRLAREKTLQSTTLERSP